MQHEILWSDYPHHFAIMTIISMGVDTMRQAGTLREPLDIIFDTQDDIRRVLNEAWDGFLATRDAETAKFFTGPPIFRDDKEFRPLQAADFLAWWVRRQFEETGQGEPPNEFVPPCGRYAWAPSRPIPTVILQPTENCLRAKVLEMKQHASGLERQRYEKILPKHVIERWRKEDKKR
jgi:hypothetical protein